MERAEARLRREARMEKGRIAEMTRNNNRENSIKRAKTAKQ